MGSEMCIRDSDKSVAFVENYASGLGGAMHIDEADLLDISNVMFMSNKASLGGAVYIAAVDDKPNSASVSSKATMQ